MTITDQNIPTDPKELHQFATGNLTSRPNNITLGYQNRSGDWITRTFNNKPGGRKMNSDLILSIFSYYSSYLPEGWLEFSIYYKFDNSSSMSFLHLVNADGVNIKPPLWLDATEMIEVGELIQKLAGEANFGSGGVTHLEIHLENSGKFKTQVGYGNIDWDNMWPDDLTAEPYTYVNMGSSF